MKNMARVAVVAATVLVAVASAFAQQPVKIGVFSAQRVSEETEDGKKIQADLNAFQDKKRKELEAKQQEIKTLQGQLTAQGLSLSADKRSELEKSIQKKILEFNSAQESANKEMQLEVQAAQNRFEERLLAVIDRFGTQEGFTLILDAGQVAWAAKAVDVTTAIVDLYNQMAKQPSPAAAAPKPAGGDGK